jgi:hypothetical protein
MNKKLLVGAGIAAGLVFFVLALAYWTMPAGSLPSYLPGHIDGSTTIHFKHGIAALLVSLAAFAFAWFQSGKNDTKGL